MMKPSEPPSADPRNAEPYGNVRLDECGCVPIPKPLRDALHLRDGTTLRVFREGDSIRLTRDPTQLETLTRGTDWGPEAFRDAGPATFGGDGT